MYFLSNHQNSRQYIRGHKHRLVLLESDIILEFVLGKEVLFKTSRLEEIVVDDDIADFVLANISNSRSLSSIIAESSE